MNHYYSVYCSSPEAKEKFETILHQIKDKSINLQLKFPENYLKDKEHPIWKYFNICDQDSNNATCKVCSAEMYIYAKGGGMRNHILLKHTLEWLEVYIEWYNMSKYGKDDKGDDWDFFQPCQNNPKSAICNICSSSQLILNMRRHVTR